MLRIFSSLLALLCLIGWVSAGSHHGRVQTPSGPPPARRAKKLVPKPVTVTHGKDFIPDAVLRVTHEEASASCYGSKQTYLVNGTSPGPVLRIRAGKTTWIRVYNDMADHNLTMHWHGLSQAVSPFADGTPAVSQWAIPPWHFFDYELCVPVDMAGTYFYHSHVAFQAISAAGPLIVEDAGVKPYKYVDDKIVFIQDMFTKTDEVIETGLTSIPFVWSGEAAMVLINGRGGGDNNGTYCRASLAVIDVQPGKTYRFRFIGATALSFVAIEIEAHDKLTVIEVEGHYTKPYNTAFMQIGPGQRISALLTTLKKPKKRSYLIQVESRERPTVTRSFAILRYSDPSPNANSVGKFYPPEMQPWKMRNTSRDFLDYVLRPLEPNHFPTASEVTRRVTMTTHQYVADGFNSITWRQNYLPWTEHVPHKPYLVALYEKDRTEFPSLERALRNDGLDPVTRTFPARLGEVLEIIIQNTGSDSNSTDIHPFHIHGAHAWDIGAGDGTYDPGTNEARLRGTQPILRDTSMLYRYNKTVPSHQNAGWRGWRLRVTQPGAWMIHCHILQHMIMGMQTVWVFGDENDILRVPRPQVEGYLTYGGSVYGNSSHDPVMVAFQSSDVWIEGQ